MVKMTKTSGRSAKESPAVEALATESPAVEAPVPSAKETSVPSATETPVPSAKETPATEKKTVNLVINGRSVQAWEGMNILGAAKMAGVDIPTLCFYKGLNDIGACRVCLVEVEGEDRLVAACNNVVREGMVVNTHSSRVRRVRKMNVELILSNHDVQCTSCVRSMNCELKKLASDLNIIDERFEKKPERSEWPQDFPLIRDGAKCIKCMRCIQVCDKIQQVGVWDLKNRATRTSVGVAGSLPIESSSCTLCGQCITHCPVGALRERDDVDRVMDALGDPETVVAVQIAPSVRVAWGETVGLSRDEASAERLVAALRSLGFDYIYDTDLAADLTIMEEGSELLHRLQDPGAHEWPMFTSCCPGWMRFLKGQHPEMAGQLSSAKSPQQMFGAVMKTRFSQQGGIDPECVFTVSIMPCLAKKNELTLPDMDSAGVGRDVDVVLTVRELGRLLKSEYLNLASLDEQDFDQPFGIASGAGHIFGATGGVMEAALRSAYFLVTGENPDPDAFMEVRGLEKWKEATVEVAGTKLRVAVVSGLANAELLIQALKRGEKSYDFVEVMACPGGCVGGGGQPINSDIANRSARADKLYGLDAASKLRFSHENPAVQSLYEDFYGAPLSEMSHKLLHADHDKWRMPGEE